MAVAASRPAAGLPLSSTCKKVTDPTDPINKLLLEVETSRLGVVQAGSKILDELAKKGLVYKMPIHPRSVGFDPSNRDGEGGLASAVLELASAIAEVGWSWDECAHAVCAEVVPGDLSVENFNILISSDCGLAFVVRLPRLRTYKLRFTSNCGWRSVVVPVPVGQRQHESAEGRCPRS